MVLYEWGVFDFGSGSGFQFGLTRQFMVDHMEDDDAISQLQPILHYDASDQAIELGKGSRWCRHPDEIDAFRAVIERSGAASFVGDRTPNRVELLYEHV
jgi:hypothetical protein